jgi:putative membrane protein
MSITKDDHAAISAAIHAAEQKTCGQIVCVLARASSDYSYVPVFWAALVALIVPWPLIVLTQLSAQAIYLIQMLVFMLAAPALAWPPIRMFLVPRSVQRTRAYRAATEQFFGRGLTMTQHRAGVLIFVSMAERYARILADHAIAARVNDAEWKAIVDLLTTHLREGRIPEGFIAAIERCGEVLARHAPPNGTPDQLPDRLYLT